MIKKQQEKRCRKMWLMLSIFALLHGQCLYSAAKMKSLCQQEKQKLIDEYANLKQSIMSFVVKSEMWSSVNRKKTTDIITDNIARCEEINKILKKKSDFFNVLANTVILRYSGQSQKMRDTGCFILGILYDVLPDILWRNTGRFTISLATLTVRDSALCKQIIRLKNINKMLPNYVARECALWAAYEGHYESALWFGNRLRKKSTRLFTKENGEFFNAFALLALYKNRTGLLVSFFSDISNIFLKKVDFSKEYGCMIYVPELKTHTVLGTKKKKEEEENVREPLTISFAPSALIQSYREHIIQKEGPSIECFLNACEKDKLIEVWHEEKRDDDRKRLSNVLRKINISYKKLAFYFKKSEKISTCMVCESEAKMWNFPFQSQQCGRKNVCIDCYKYRTEKVKKVFCQEHWFDQQNEIIKKCNVCIHLSHLDLGFLVRIVQENRIIKPASELALQEK
ncbi:MAG TPA: hypothetical protein VEK38_00705 [Candidatus Bathyarchaeia archaeon]|nr:hypothetical protein [Candidatus Bathyarchaeia archaeon]